MVYVLRQEALHICINKKHRHLHLQSFDRLNAMKHNISAFTFYTTYSGGQDVSVGANGF